MCQIGFALSGMSNILPMTALAPQEAYFEEVEGKPIKAFRIPAMIDKILRLFISSGGFDID